jgi:hypothetical protein
MAGGPLVLSWQDVMASCGGEGFNVVIHEFAHKLDMKNGAVDGLPPLHSGMSVAVWSAAFNAAYDDFRQRVERGEEPEIDPYAAENPAEFFRRAHASISSKPRMCCRCSLSGGLPTDETVLPATAPGAACPSLRRSGSAMTLQHHDHTHQDNGLR